MAREVSSGRGAIVKTFRWRVVRHEAPGPPRYWLQAENLNAEWINQHDEPASYRECADVLGEITNLKRTLKVTNE